MNTACPDIPPIIGRKMNRRFRQRRSRISNLCVKAVPMSTPMPSSRIWLHRLALLTAASAFFLLFLGGLVTSHQAGLSVPDWPTSYGWNMFTFPMKDWVGNIFYEHTHRLFASFVGFLILVQAILIQRYEVRRWVKRLGWY